MAVGLLALAGWLFDIPTLTSIVPGMTTIKANTALGFILCGISLGSHHYVQSKNPIRVVAIACAAVVLLMAVLTLGEYLSKRDFGIDQLLFEDKLTPQNLNPGRMSPAAALNFTLLGFALLLLSHNRYQRLLETLTISALFIATLALVGYAYGVPSLYQVVPYSSTALPTALAFAILSVGILLARPELGLMEILSSDRLGSAMARRLLPAAVVTPILLGWLFLGGQRMGIYDSTLQLVLFALSNVIIFAILILRNADLLSRLDLRRKEAETALSLNEKRAHALIENSWDAIALLDADGIILYGSPSTPQILGYSLEEFVGRSAFELIREDDQALVNERLRRSIQRPGEHIRFYARLRHKNGEWRWLEGVLTNLLDEPSVQAIVNNYHDFTERKEAETALQKLNTELERQVQERTAALSRANALLQMMLEQMPDHIYFKDTRSRFISNSRSQAKALGLHDPAEAVGKSDFDFFPDAQQSFEIEQEIIRSGKPVVDQEERVVWPDGRESWVSTTKVPLRDPAGQIIGTFGISRDITERKRAEAALQKAKLELEAANKELEAFSYSVSHDLRAPLRSVDGFSQALLEDYGELLPAEGRNFLERIRSSAQRMAALIDDLLNLSRVTRAPLHIVPVDLSKLAENILEELKRIDAGRDVKIRIAKNLKAGADPHLLQIVLENLISNAWKFTSGREMAEIEIGSKDENGETTYFIRDNGAGFDMTYASKLFGAFQRLHAMTEFPGTGIGLATIQRIIHRHGGRVWAQGAVDQGATFYFTLPVLADISARPALREEDSIYKRVKEII